MMWVKWKLGWFFETLTYGPTDYFPQQIFHVVVISIWIRVYRGKWEVWTPCALRPPPRTIKTKFPQVKGKFEASRKLMVMKNHLQKHFPASVFPNTNFQPELVREGQCWGRAAAREAAWDLESHWPAVRTNTNTAGASARPQGLPDRHPSWHEARGKTSLTQLCGLSQLKNVLF